MSNEMENSERKILTFEEADKLIAHGEFVHTFINSGGMLLGCDMERAELLAAETFELSGQIATKLGHGIAAYFDGRWIFIKTVEREK